MKEYWKIKAYFPVIELPEDMLVWSFKDRWYILKNKDDVLKSSPVLNDAYELLLECDPIWRMWTYKWVFNLTEWLECFTVDEWSNAPKWKIWETPFVNVFIFETYFDFNETTNEQLENFTKKLAELHPYEVPVIEIIDKKWIRMFN